MLILLGILAWCVNVGLSIFFKIFVTLFTNLILLYFLSSDFQKFVDFVASSFMSPQIHIDHGNQMKGPPPFLTSIYSLYLMNSSPNCLCPLNDKDLLFYCICIFAPLLPIWKGTNRFAYMNIVHALMQLHSKLTWQFSIWDSYKLVNFYVDFF